MNNKDRLIEIGKSFLSEEGFSAGCALYDELKSLNFDEGSLSVAFFARSDISNPAVREGLSSEIGAEAVEKIELFNRISKLHVPNSQKNIAMLRKIFLDISSDLKIIIMKLYERLAILRIRDKENAINLQETARECLDLYAPIAHRLGIRQVYNPMEDICFRRLYPQEFSKLNTAVEKRRSYLEDKLKKMSDSLRALLKQRNIQAQIQARVKRLYSIHKKLVNQNSSIDRIFDLMALRVVTNSVEDCYLALGAVHSTWVPIENRFRDWVTFPKPNGYRSIQTTVLLPNGDKFEIQIRTEEMHREAEYGSAAHWAYKEKISVDTSRISRLKEFLENDEFFDNPSALDEMLKSEARRNFIHILTPRGELKTLQEGSTALDFAFSIHTDVGYKATGARRNGKFAKLKTKLESGDIVEIITNKNGKPSRDWLSFVVSPAARSKIALWIKKNEKSEIEAEGKREWERFKKRRHFKIETSAEEQSIKQNVQKIGFKNTDDFYAAIGMKSLKLSITLLKKLFPASFEKKQKNEDGVFHSRKNVGKKELPIEVDGLRDIKTSLARCCNPIKGEPIVAYFTKNVDLKIHSADCKYISDGGLDPSRIKRANWIEGDNTLQTIKLQVTGWQYSSLFSLAVEKATDEKILIEGSERKQTNDKLDSLVLTLQISSSEQLSNFRNKLLASSIVQSVRVVG